jgi:hypothetical protein
VVLRNLPAQVEQEYTRHYRELDPLRPALFERTDMRVVCMDETLTEAELLASEYYQQYCSVR